MVNQKAKQGTKLNVIILPTQLFNISSKRPMLLELLSYFLNSFQQESTCAEVLIHHSPNFFHYEYVQGRLIDLTSLCILTSECGKAKYANYNKSYFLTLL